MLLCPAQMIAAGPPHWLLTSAAKAFRYEDFIRKHTDKRPNPYLTIASLMTQCDAVGEDDLKEFPDFFLLV